MLDDCNGKIINFKKGNKVNSEKNTSINVTSTPGQIQEQNNSNVPLNDKSTFCEICH